MEVFDDIGALRTTLRRARERRPVVLVPTMGALHDGHGACVEVAREVERGLVVVSIFVNPSQFGPGEDLLTYPRDLDRDLAVCRRWGVGVVFAPPVETMYPSPQDVWVEVEELARPLCGRSRPGHFRGVATVVAKLFGIVTPQVAVFGQKDAQQALVIREMVRGLDMPVELRLARTVREADGLALSSRNVNLDGQERRRAAGIYQALLGAARLIEAGERDGGVVEDAVKARLGEGGVEEVEYAELRSAGDLSPMDRLQGRVILAVAARVGGTRLIDNMVFEVTSGGAVVDVALF